MRKFDDSKVVKALEERRVAGEELASLENRLSRVSKELDEANESLDLNSDTDFLRVLRLETWSRAIPTRISRQQDVIVGREAALLSATHTFIEQQLTPVVESEIRKHKADICKAIGVEGFQEVEQAFRLSKRGRELAQISASCSVVAVPPEGAVRYATHILDMAGIV